MAPSWSPGSRIAGLIRLTHPFPSVLDAVATSAIALLAGGDELTALRLGGSMLALQASIGALNDLLDAPADAGRKPGKPIPSGQVTSAGARTVAVLGASIGLLLAAPSGPGTLVIAVAALAIGYGYDLWAKGTSWSWLPFALGIPLLPVFAWYGAVERIPGQFAILVPAAVAAGAALAISNARADLERDIAAGRGSIAVRLGSGSAWMMSTTLYAAVIAVALGSLWQSAASQAAQIGAAAAAAVIAVGVALAHGAAATPARRERAWEIQAIGVAVLAAAWLAAAGDLG